MASCRNSNRSALFALAFALLAAPAAVLRADTDTELILQRAKQNREKQRAACREFIAGLELTDRQVRALVDLADRAAALHVEAYRAQARLLPEMADAFADFAREDSLNQGFTLPVEARTAQLSHESKTAEESFVKQMNVLERQAIDLLSGPQLDYAKNFQPGKPGGNHIVKDPNATFGRSKPKGDRPERFASRRAKPKPPPTSDERIAAARQELAKISRQIHPQLGPLGQYLLHPVGGDALCSMMGVRSGQHILSALEISDRGTPEYHINQHDVDETRIATLSAEINNWNLINGLHLNRGQIGQVLTLCDAFQASQEQPADRRPHKHHVHPVAVEPKPTVADLERAVEKVMNPGQRKVLAEYRACLIPPANLKDPVRIGQANDYGYLESWLAGARKMSAKQLVEAIAKLIDGEARYLGQLPPDERLAREKLLRQTAEQAAKMSDVDFEIGKAELAEKIAPRDRIMDLQHKIDTLARAEGQPGKINQFMIQPKFIEQLRTRDRQLAQGIVTEQADLAKGPQAGNCKGGCAVNPKGGKGKTQGRNGDQNAAGP